MPATVLRSVNLESFTWLGWLPAGGQGNDLHDHAWAPVLELSPGDVRAVLTALRAASVPAYAAPARSGKAWLPAQDATCCCWKLWVGTSAYGTAEAALLAVMPALTRRRHSGGDWA